MDTSQKSLIHFEKPPVIEVVCGILFRPIKTLLAPHLGLFWNKFKSEYPSCQEVPPIAPIIETFGSIVTEVAGVELTDIPPLPRVWFIHQNETGIIQVQRDRFLYNWRKVRPEDEYPRYYNVIEEFQKYWEQFRSFLSENNLGDPLPRQYEMTYVNYIPQGAGWENTGKIGELFPDFSYRGDMQRFLPDPEGVNWRLSFPFPEKDGRLNVTIRILRQPNPPIISFELTARGVKDELRKWFDLAHEWIVYGFSDLTGKEVQKNVWKRIE